PGWHDDTGAGRRGDRHRGPEAGHRVRTDQRGARDAQTGRGDGGQAGAPNVNFATSHDREHARQGWRDDGA
ncbi:hypothetical protein T484DRAFT_1890560, partial [Baffinella frigidus]